jgi:hypothetical protein
MEHINQTQFRLPDDEKQNIERSAKPPQCMLDLPKQNLTRENLTDDQLEVYKTQCLRNDGTKLECIRSMKFYIDPKIPGQHFGLVSFIPSKGATPDNDGCFGVLKVRGNFHSEEEADKWSERLIREYDNYSEIDVIYVGRPFPLMANNEIYTRSTREIDVKKKVDDVTKSAIKDKMLKDQQELKEIQQRQSKLLNKSTEEQKEKSLDDLEYYTELRVKKASALATIEDCHKREKEAESVQAETSSEIEKLDKLYPEYQKEYMEKYENALRAIGADITKNPIIKYMKN